MYCFLFLMLQIFFLFSSADEKHRTAFWIQNSAFKQNAVISLVLKCIFIWLPNTLDCSVNMTQY